MAATVRALGMAAFRGNTTCIAPPACSIPNARALAATTSIDGQTDLVVRIYQGDRAETAANELLGEFTFSGVRPARAGEARLEVVFEVNVEGILTMSARDLDSGRQMKTTVRVSSS